MKKAKEKNIKKKGVKKKPVKSEINPFKGRVTERLYT
jgi:hypothetical protein